MKLFRLTIYSSLFLYICIGWVGFAQAEAPLKEPLQFTSAGHILRFDETGVMAASMNHMLKVSFIEGNDVSPAADENTLEHSNGAEANPIKKVTYDNAWEGIAVTYEGKGNSIFKSTYFISPEKDGSIPVDRIRLNYNREVEIDENGNLNISYDTGTLTESAPMAWQEIAGLRKPVSVSYVIRANREVGFSLGEYIPGIPVVIDPELNWNTFLGGSGADYGYAIAVDGSGNVYVGGYSGATWGSPVRAHYGSGNDAFAVKLDSSGNLTWNTFLGGSGVDYGYAIAVDGSGNVYVGGRSSATWGSPVRAHYGSGYDAFAVKLDSSGNLTWDTFLGGSGTDYGMGIAVDAGGNVYVGGYGSATWGSPVRAHYGSGNDAFAVKLNSSGTLTWNTFLGDSGADYGMGIAVDAGGNVYVGGYGNATWGSPVRAYTSNDDAFAVKLDSSGNLTWNTFLGDSYGEYGYAIAVDASGNVYVGGYSYATWGSPVRAYYGSGTDAFAAKLDSSGNLTWNTFLGDSGTDVGLAIAVDGSGNVYVGGYGNATWGSPVRAYASSNDAFAVKLNSSGALAWNTFLGGSGADYGTGIAVDAGGNVYVGGYGSATWGSPVRAHYGSGDDAFAAKIIGPATEFTSIVDPGGAGDYSSLSGWNTGVATDLTASKVFSGTRDNTVADNTTVYLCDSANSYRGESATVVHATATQILVEGITSGVVEISTDYWYSTNTCSGGTKYFTLSDGGDSAIAVATCRTTNGAADTAAVSITGWTTSATNYIKIWTDPTEGYRHSGKWDEGKYRLEVSSNTDALSISEDYVKIDGLQIKNTITSGSWLCGLVINTLSAGSNRTDISGNIIVGVYGSGASGHGIAPAHINDNAYIYNNIIYGFTSSAGYAGIHSYGTTYAYNNTIYGNFNGLRRDTGTLVAKNNISYDNANGDYLGTFDASSTNNLSKDATAPAYNTYYQNATVTFVNANKNDFHLADNDAGAKNYGADLAADTNLAITNDIDGSTRPTGSNIVDIGADEAATQIYYSVGQNTNNNETGAGNVDVDAATRTATFTVAQTATNMGVGDVIDYDSDNKKCYITEKVSTTVWKCQSATGGAPTDSGGNVAVNSIHHVFSSLYSSITGSDDLLSATDLVTGNYILNIPCYYDTGTDSGFTANIDGYTTGHANYIKIYTPNNTTTEVNQTQRHSGKWDAQKYSLTSLFDWSYVIIVNDNDVRIDGLQINLDNDYTYGMNVYPGTDEIQISNNLVFSTAVNPSIGIFWSSTKLMKIWNNIVYDCGYNLNQWTDQPSTSIIYNNTAVDAVYDNIAVVAQNIYIKNNIAQGSSSRDDYALYAPGTYSHSNNLSEDTTSPDDTYDSKAVLFINESNKDFHLAFPDTVAKGYGTNLMNDPYLPFQNDIDGKERTGNWSIGADEPREMEIQSSEQKSESITDGLVLYQSFDGGDMDWSDTDAEARDQSGNNNNGDVSGATSAIGKRGQALDFDGIDQIVSIADDDTLDVGPLTISFWAKIRSHAKSYNTLIGKYGSSSNYSIYLSTGGALCVYSDGGTCSTFDIDTVLNQWAQITMVMSSGSSTDIYVNGTFIENIARGYGATNDVPMYIGGQGGYDEYTDGSMDEVRIYNRALLVDEIGDLYRLGETTRNASQADKMNNGLVLSQSFDGQDISGATTYDRSGNGHNGTIETATPAFGHNGQALGFPGVGIGVSLTPFSVGTVHSASVWLDWQDTVDGVIIGRPLGISAETSGYIMYIDGTNIYYNNGGNSGSDWVAVAHGGLASGEWNHLAVVRDGTSVKFYKNGQQLGTNQTLQTNTALTDIAAIGSYGSGTYPAKMRLDEVRIYDRAITPSEVGDLYRMGTATMSR